MNEKPNQGGFIGQACSYVGQAWLVILLALLYGGALAGVQSKLGPLIEKNKKDETYGKIPSLVGVPEATGEEDEKRISIREQTVAGSEDHKPYRVYQAFFDGQLKGWVLPASGLGFADRIDLLIGLGPDLSTITGLYVLDQKETPGLGNYITSEDLFLRHFAGKSADKELTVVKGQAAAGSNQIPALSGATISSESVAEIVNKAVKNLRGPLRQLPSAPPATPGGAPGNGGG